MSGRNRSTVKSRRRCQRRDGTDGNLDGAVEVEGLLNSSAAVAQRVPFRKERSETGSGDESGGVKIRLGSFDAVPASVWV